MRPGDVTWLRQPVVTVATVRKGFPPRPQVAYRREPCSGGHSGWTGWGIGMLRYRWGVTSLCARCAAPDGSDAYPGRTRVGSISPAGETIPAGSVPARGPRLSEFVGWRYPKSSTVHLGGGQSSRFAPAVSSLRRQVEQTRDHLGSGYCQSSLDQLATGLAAVSRAIERLKHDADAARSSAYRVDTATITRAWNTAVRSEFAMTDECGN